GVSTRILFEPRPRTADTSLRRVAFHLTNVAGRVAETLPGVSARLLFCAFLAVSLLAQDWPQFLGPARNGTYSGKDLGAKWPASGPPLLWKKEAGAGFSSPVVSQGKLLIFHRREGKDLLDCLDAKSGAALWTYESPTGYRDDFGFDEGPRSTPAIAGGRVFIFGAEGVLQAIDFASGKKIWSVDTHRQFGVQKGFFGAACSPVVDGARVLMNIGGPKSAGIVAFDAATGKTLWTATNDEAGYASPVVAAMAGAKHALFFTRAGLIDADPETGKVRAQLPWRARMQASVNAAAPLVVNDLVLASASYGVGAILVRVTANGFQKIWSSDDALSSHYAAIVHRDGFLYGFHGRQEEGASLRCIELNTGKVRWNVDGLRAGTVTLAGDRLLIQREDGELVVAASSPDAFRPLMKAKLLPAVVRSYPAISGGIYYLRNERTLAAFSLR
ncbi:MAG: PQQ-binding-like beta-propeller repeat protein, partial [Bryobacteraceae bacterium]